MGRQAEPDAEQLELQLRRRRRPEERSFRMDRRSPAAAALRDALVDVLSRFLGNYYDETFVEYIVVLVCNGKNQHQAHDDLEEFLGDNTAKFVSWLWGYLSKHASASSDNCSFQHGVDDECENLNDNKKAVVKKDPRGDAPIVCSKISVPQAYHDRHRLDSTKRQTVTTRCVSSTSISSPEGFSGDRCISEDQHCKRDLEGCRSLSMSQHGVTERTEQILNHDEFHGERLGRNASTRLSPEAVGTDGRMLVPLKRRSSVWERLGKPVAEEHRRLRETHDVHLQNGAQKKARLMVDEHGQRYRVDSNAHDTFNSARNAGNGNRSRLIGRLSFGDGTVFQGDVERNHVQDRDVFRQKSNLSLPVKSIKSQSSNEFTTEMKGLPAAVSEPTCTVSRPPAEHGFSSNKLPPQTMHQNLRTEVIHREKVSSPVQSKTISSVNDNGASCRNKPVKKEILDMKLKLKQMELDVLKLRSKQEQINNGKQGAQSLGPHANLSEDVDSRTILVMNVHFAATKEALSMHFMKCGTVLKTNILTDAITGHPKGAAYVTFADKESVDKAVSLSGTSFLTRVLTITRKADAPPGFLATVQQTGSPLQTWNSPPFHKGSTPMNPSGFHRQWKRDQ